MELIVLKRFFHLSMAQKLREASLSSELPRRTRRAYTRADYRQLAQHYSDETGSQLAQLLGRSVGSLYQFVKRHPELQKRPRA